MILYQTNGMSSGYDARVFQVARKSGDFNKRIVRITVVGDGKI